MNTTNTLPFQNKSSKVLVKKIENLASEYGCLPQDRSLKDYLDLGFVIINKPDGPTSHQVSAFVKDILGVKKCGHAGTLDPKVTGVLPVAIGNATKVLQTLLTTGKEYVCIMQLHKPITREQLDEAVLQFTGEISQLPPVKSAIKRQLRTRTIYYIDVLEFEPTRVLFTVGCEAGTYIRKLCHDMGEYLGVGAHMDQLHRTQAGSFVVDDLVTLQELTDALYYAKQGDESHIRRIVKTVERAVSHVPKIWVSDLSINPICHGSKVFVSDVLRLESGFSKGDMVAIMSQKDELVALARASQSFEGIAQNESGVAAQTDRVVMKGTFYPKLR